MAWKKYIVPNHCITVLFEFWKWDCEIYFSKPLIESDCKLETKLWDKFDVYLVECPFVVHSDFGIMMEELGNYI